MTAYYNEHDPFAAQWLRNLIDARHIAPGVVDERDIRDVKPDELKQYEQCHFFAGVGVWSLALRRAGWPDDKPVWTGSCPCQPFSAAGRRGGTADERHLWPHWYHLITQCEPDHIFGEQVASKDGLGWLDLVQTDLEGANYANGAVDLCAAGVGAPHIRQRLWFAAERLGHAKHERSQGRVYRGPDKGREDINGHAGRNRAASGLADAQNYGPDQGREDTTSINTYGDAARPTDPSGCGRLADPDSHGRSPRSEAAETAGHRNTFGAKSGDDRPRPTGPTNGYWKDVDWLLCRDEKWRPVEPSTFPLVDGATARVVRLRAYGNAVNAQAAQAFIEACT